MSINWQDLRSLNGSQDTAFEELCCQLAGTEAMPSGSRFIRKGAPDAGVECYWTLPDGAEWGWQAKFFRSTPEKTQWVQLDESVKTALEKHPHLRRYVICLPLDRQDPRIDQQKWFMDKWDEHVESWKGLAKDKGITLEVDYWGSYEIFERLSLEEHGGRYYFWFTKELFSREWFQARVEEAIANVGPRYSPELDVQLPISQLFHALGRTPEFYAKVKKFFKQIRKTSRVSGNEYLPEKLQNFNHSLDLLLKASDNFSQSNVDDIDWNNIVETASNTLKLVGECERALSSLAESFEKSDEAKSKRGEIDHLRRLASDYWRLYGEIDDLNAYGTSNEASLSNKPKLVLVAEAGRGKTHLFCDIANHRIKANLPTVLLIGGQFNTEEPWSQIIRLLGLSCNRDEFLGALESAAQAYHARAVILIDALNEGQGKTLWKKHLAGILLTLSKRKNLGLCINVRTSYENTVIPDGLVPSTLLRAEHHGFAEYEYEATKTFFDYFGIQRPSIPLLVPEFQNPLFLKIFCQGLKNKGMTSIPSGLQGITAIFKFFVESVNQKLSSVEYLDFNPKKSVVWEVVEKMASELAKQSKDWLPAEEAEALINTVLPRDGYENSLFRHLLSEGLVAENRFYIGNNTWSDGVHFAYERLSDHLIAKYLLDTYLDISNPQKLFTENTLGSRIQDEQACNINRGLIEAFSIQLPELVRKELFELALHIQDYHGVVLAFVQSLIWRDPHALNMEVVTGYINVHVIRNKYTHDDLLDALLTVSVNPEHPLNADFLHGNLIHLEIAERDAWWSIFLHEQYKNYRAVDRLVEWAWLSEDKSKMADESLRLCGVILSWFLTTSNRYLRDRATKALVKLFTNRLRIFLNVLQNFFEVNDLYVYERLMAVAYGCAMRSNDDEALYELAESIYSHIFKDSNPLAHILLRDYARGVIEFAIHRGIALNVDLKRARPPYGSAFPEDIPSEEVLKEKYNNFEKVKSDIEYAQSTIWGSVMGFGDFARYIIGTNFGFFGWSSRKLTKAPSLSREERFDAFISILTPRQKRAFERYKIVRENAAFWHRLDEDDRKEYFKTEITSDLLDMILLGEEERLRKLLGKKKSALLSEDIFNYIDNPGDDEYSFDLSLAQRWILKRVFEFGWTIERFGQFDRFTDYYGGGREANKPERIGKKYQWIAYHEFLALVADNFEFRGDRLREPEPGGYQGPWQGLYVRNIDPSWTLPKTQEISNLYSFEPIWWAPNEMVWNTALSEKDWIRESDDLPIGETLISVINPENNSKWLTLESSYRWKKANSFEDDALRYPSKDIVYLLQSYIVKKSDSEILFQWMKTQWRANHDYCLPDSHSLSHVFLGEFFWSPAYLYHNDPYYGRNGWIGGENGDKIPRPILLSTDQYSESDRGYDCSVNESVHVYLPCKWIVDNMGLTWRGDEGYYYDKQGNLIAFDPSVKQVGPGAIIVDRELFLDYLDKNGLTILWVITGEKLIITGGIPKDDWSGRLNILGVYRIEDGKIIGGLNTKLEE